ncbi:MAG TPA: beta-ketoacyl synthase N-terminal-like domain-containing protein [Micromonosporaceae bacterium]
MEAAELRRLVEDQLRLSRRLRARIRELEEERRAPLAIVGMALRFPGGSTTPEEYWEFLLGDGTGIGDIPVDRPGLRSVYHPEVGRRGSSYVDRAGFLSDVASFDADFFGISHREAEALDPQQRLLLETTWEALERAGISVRRADRLDAGVFVGIMSSEYGERLAAGDPQQLDPYYGTGGGLCFAAGRISYILGLRGPAFSVDTACSSSLVALHQAVRSLRARECRYAIVGAANLIFSPHLMVSLCQSRALAPDGRSKPFTAAADGYGRGEGVATVVLMRLADAIAERRPVLAVVRGSAVNHDGASSGLTVPSGPAQVEVIQAALRDAGVDPAEVSYVEAHGTGTSLGDPIEAGALETVFGPARAATTDRLLVGSVKGRVGHLEAAAGLAGLIKLVLMLRHERIVADVPDAEGPLNPAIPWSEWRLEVPRRSRSWTGPGRIAGISAFGLSGTNAHVVVQSADALTAEPAGAAAAPDRGRRDELLVLSARSAPALRALAASVATHLLRVGPDDLASVCHTLRAGRTPMPYRLAVTADDPAEMARLLSLAAGTTPSAAPGGAPRSAVLITAADPTDALAARVADLAADLPLLADRDADVADPAGAVDRLVRAFGALGLPVTVRSGLVPDGYVAAVEYDGRRVGLLPTGAGRVTAVFLAALGELFQAGADLRFDALATPDARFVPDLPTYPFQRRRYWIPEVKARRTEPATDPEAPRDPQDGAAVNQDAIAEILRAELAAVLKADGDLDLRCTFAEVGGDSFTAMLFVQSVEDRFQAEDLVTDFAADQPLGDLLAALAKEITERTGARS